MLYINFCWWIVACELIFQSNHHKERFTPHGAIIFKGRGWTVAEAGDVGGFILFPNNRGATVNQCIVLDRLIIHQIYRASKYWSTWSPLSYVFILKFLWNACWQFPPTSAPQQPSSSNISWETENIPSSLGFAHIFQRLHQEAALILPTMSGFFICIKPPYEIVFRHKPFSLVMS